LKELDLINQGSEGSKKFKLKKQTTLNDKMDEFEEDDVTAESIAQEMLDLGVHLDPVTDYIPKFRLPLVNINFAHLITKAFFYMFSKQNKELSNIIGPLYEVSNQNAVSLVIKD
jgi:hypothetical protein